MVQGTSGAKRTTIFISKATPEDDEFVLWLAPRLEAAGYEVFADILTLEPGDRWRKVVTNTLQEKSIKMILCCQDSTLNKNGVQEEIAIAEDLSKELNDPRFIIPLRLKPFKKIFGIGGLQYVNFVGSWAFGLDELLRTLKKQNVPCAKGKLSINPEWESYRKRLAINVDQSPEALTLNWLRVVMVPERIRYYQPVGAINLNLMELSCRGAPFPAEPHLRGFFSFASTEDIETEFSHVGKFQVKAEISIDQFLESGFDSPAVHFRVAGNIVTSMLRHAWEQFCREKGLHEHRFSNQPAFHINRDTLSLGKKIPWGKAGQPRSSMLRNKARGKVWQYGISASPSLWPFPHYKLKSRVLFAELAGKEAGQIFVDSDQQHRLRRSVCSGWRNKAWHGRLMAFLKVISEDSPTIHLLISSDQFLTLEASPTQVTSPVTTVLPDHMDDDAEEQDQSTLGNYIPEEVV